MYPSEAALLRALARELRSCDGMERTPDECRILSLRFRDSRKSPLKGLTLSAFICRVLDDPDLMQIFARTCRFKDQDKIPSSAELGI